MKTIRVSCPLCRQEAVLLPDEVTLRFSRDADTCCGTASYSFLCPHCRCAVERRATNRDVTLLCSAGVKTEGERTPDAPITEEEIARFREALDRPDWPKKLRGDPSCGPA